MIGPTQTLSPLSLQQLMYDQHPQDLIGSIDRVGKGDINTEFLLLRQGQKILDGNDNLDRIYLLHTTQLIFDLLGHQKALLSIPSFPLHHQTGPALNQPLNLPSSINKGRFHNLTNMKSYRSAKEPTNFSHSKAFLAKCNSHYLKLNDHLPIFH